MINFVISMKMKQVNIDYSKLTKLYYSIGEVSSLLNVNASLIRFWEKELELNSPKKNKKGNRQFTVKEIKNLELIYQIVKIEGYKLDAAKKQLKIRKSDSKGQFSKNKELINKLQNIKNKLIQLKN
ncbi:MAG: MerR family transcriptional regulator [Crocinitomicaceae bacterium]|nr:MerR family transcriptional regulator [Crocinitomicaceae bacterium]